MKLIVQDNRTVTFDPTAADHRDTLLAQSAMIGSITSAEANEKAAAASAQLKALVNEVEAQRKEVKAPVIALGKEIDAVAATFISEVQDELTRINRAMGDYAALQLAKQRAEEAKRRLELEQIERERRAAEEKARAEAEAKRRELEQQAAQAARLEAQAKSEAEAEAAKQLQAEIERKRAIAEAQSLQQVDAINAEFSRTSAAVKPVERFQASGQSVKEEWEFEVFDLHALYRANPACVKLTPLATEIKAVLKANNGQLSGVRAWKGVKSSTRGAQVAKLIEV